MSMIGFHPSAGTERLVCDIEWGVSLVGGMGVLAGAGGWARRLRDSPGWLGTGLRRAMLLLPSVAQRSLCPCGRLARSRIQTLVGPQPNYSQKGRAGGSGPGFEWTHTWRTSYVAPGKESFRQAAAANVAWTGPARAHADLRHARPGDSSAADSV